MVGLRKLNITVNQSKGFTVIELTLVIAIIGILAAIVFAYVPQALVAARNSERVSDAKAMSRFFEQKYKENASASYATYPSTASFSTDIGVLLAGGLKDAAIAPNQTTNSVSAASGNGDLTSTITIQNYIYQPFASNGSLCTASTSTSPCVRYKIWYKLENVGGPVRIVESRYQQ